MRGKLIVVAAAVLCLVGLWLIFQPDNKPRKEAERTRKQLQSKGFKMELSEFHLSTTPEIHTRADAILEAGQQGRDLGTFREIELARAAGSNTAFVLWRAEKLATDAAEDYWPALKASLGQRREVLDNACAAASAGRFRFEPNAQRTGVAVPYLMNLRSVAIALSLRAVLELHQDNLPGAWTNLNALTRLATAWDTEPIELAYFSKFSCVIIAQRTLWEALQKHAWTDEQLAALQKEWASASLLAGLPESAAMARANGIAYCASQRQQPPPPPLPFMQSVSDFANSPTRGWAEMTSSWRESRYRHVGTFEDETALMLYYSELETDLQKALNYQSWADILGSIPIATNSAPGQERVRYTVLAGLGPPGGYSRAGQTIFIRAAEAETRRRLIVSALAIERYRLKEGILPDSLQQLVPTFAADVPTDFMDSKPLRYRRSNGDGFVLYSVGLDCVDDGGVRQIPELQRRLGPGFPRGFSFNRPEGPDVLWPLAASAAQERADAERDAARRIADQPPLSKSRPAL